MIFKADAYLIRSLLELPETGMGYQIIEARRPDYLDSKGTFIVYNSEIIVEWNATFDSNKKRLFSEGYRNTLYNASVIELNSIRLLSRQTVHSIRFFSEWKMDNFGRQQGGRGAADNPQQHANGSSVFVRLSAYEDDRRIDNVNNCLKPGAYTTTQEDYKDCKRYNDDPVDRYALPNDEEIKWAFYIRPATRDLYRIGIVQPANNHNGGGVEALFDNGTSEGTYFDKKPY